MTSTLTWLTIALLGGAALMLAEVGKLIAADIYRAGKHLCSAAFDKYKLWRAARRQRGHEVNKPPL